MKRLALIVSTILVIGAVNPAGAGPAYPAAPGSRYHFDLCQNLGIPVAFATASSPSAAVPGDFNEDGITDLAVSCGTRVSILVGLGAAGVGNGTYAAPVDISLTGCRDVATGDFNDDGITDLVATVAGGAAVLLGNGTGGVGNGTFGSPTTFAAATNPQRVVTADFNEDGITDLAVTNSVSNSVSILVGQGTGGIGSGTFAAAVNHATGSTPVALLSGDFNEDGITDLAVANNNAASNSVSILIGGGAGGAGDGTFAAAVHYPTGGSNPAGMTSGDWNEDGRTDLAVVNGNSGNIAILSGNGTGGTGNGTFAAPTLMWNTLGGRDVGTADFNGDGVADLVMTNITSDRVDVLRGSGAGTVGNGSFFGSTNDSVGLDPRCIARGDFNEDGAPDVVTVKAGGSAAVVIPGECVSGLDASLVAFENAGQVWPVGTEQYIGWTRGAAVMAVNIELSRDGGVNWETVATNVTNGNFQWTVTLPATGEARLRISDSAVPTRFDESNVDFAICAPFIAGAPIPAGGQPQHAVAADFNEDGIQDLAIASFGTNEVRVLTGNGIRGVGNGTFGPDPTLVPLVGGPGALVAGDFNEDGITDLAVGIPGAGLVEILFGAGVGGIGNGLFQIEPIDLPVAAGPGALVAGDFNEDGVTDLAVACTTDDIIAILIGFAGSDGVGNGLFAAPVNIAVSSPSDIVSGDFDEDGIIDLVVISDGTSNLVRLEGEGVGGVGSGVFHIDPICPPVTPLHGAITTGDFNGDGITDLVVTNPAVSTLSILAGLGSGSVGNGVFAMPIEFGVGLVPLALQKGDFNHDGITDLAVAGTGAGGTGKLDLLYGGGLEATGNGTFSSRMTFATGAGAVQILAGDFLEDNTTDLFVVSSAASTVTPLFGGCQDPDFVSIQVTTPNGGEVFPVGSQRTISWTADEVVGAVDVEISRDGGNNWEPILLNTTETSLAWTVTPPLSSNALVRVAESGLPNRADMSNALFWIATSVGVGGPGDDENGSGPAVASLLSAAYPNPFSVGEVHFGLALPKPAQATIDVYDAAGRLVRRLADRTFTAGEHEVAWDGRADGGARQPDGIYFLRARWDGFTAVRKVVRTGGSR